MPLSHINTRKDQWNNLNLHCNRTINNIFYHQIHFVCSQWWDQFIWPFIFPLFQKSTATATGYLDKHLPSFRMIAFSSLLKLPQKNWKNLWLTDNDFFPFRSYERRDHFSLFGLSRFSIHFFIPRNFTHIHNLLIQRRIF